MTPTQPTPTPATEPQTFVIAVHAVGLIAVALSLWLALVGPLKGYPEAAGLLLVGVSGLYGKLGYKPAGPILDRIVAKLAEREPLRVARLTSKPPPARVSD